MSKTLFTNVNILDSTGAQPFLGEVLVVDERITDVRAGSGNLPREDVKVIDGHGQTLMSGLCDAHTHFTWNDGDLNGLETMQVEEHLLHTVQSAKTYIDYGYTMCFGAASAKKRLDVVVRNAINAGDIPPPATWPTARKSPPPPETSSPASPKSPMASRKCAKSSAKPSD